MTKVLADDVGNDPPDDGDYAAAVACLTDAAMRAGWLSMGHTTRGGEHDAHEASVNWRLRDRYIRVARWLERVRIVEGGDG